MRYQGKITYWNDDRGFGFITPDSGGRRLYFHIKSISSRQRRPIVNEAVTYEVGNDAKGRFRAENVVFPDNPAPSLVIGGKNNAALLFALVFLIFVMVTTLVGKLSQYVLGTYIVTSVVAFTAYGLDKLAAERNQRRTQESTLHLFALIGGWPGALLAQRLIRHKSRKPSFQLVFWITVVLNCGVLAWLCSSSGPDLIRSMIGAR